MGRRYDAGFRQYQHPVRWYAMLFREGITGIQNQKPLCVPGARQQFLQPGERAGNAGIGKIQVCGNRLYRIGSIAAAGLHEGHVSVVGQHGGNDPGNRGH